MNAEVIKRNYFNAVDLIEQTIKKEIKKFGDDGLYLHIEDDTFKVIEEVNPNEFRIIQRVRVHNDELEVVLVGDDEWTSIMGITDWVYFLDEVMFALDSEEKEV
jgi:hypothetical protein